jgi:hypothetical protein
MSVQLGRGRAMTQLGHWEIGARTGGILNRWPAVGLVFAVVRNGHR